MSKQKQMAPGPKLRAKPEILSEQARKFLLNRYKDSNLVKQIAIMLTGAANANRLADLHQRDSTRYHKPQKTGPIEMPTSLNGLTTESPPDPFYKSKGPIMPNIGLYSPRTEETKAVFAALKSRNGQEFMKREYHWLTKDPKSGEWIIKKPVEKKKTELGSLVPKKKIHSVPTRV